MPRCVPSLDVFPFEEASEKLVFAGHSRPGQVDFGLCENPGQLSDFAWARRIRIPTSWVSLEQEVEEWQKQSRRHRERRYTRKC